MRGESIIKQITQLLKEVSQYALYNLKKYYKKVLTGIFPAKTLSTFFGIGHLPEWQGHWASLLIIPMITLLVYVLTNFEGSIIDLSIPAAVAAIVLFPIGILSIYILHLKDSSADDEIMIHAVFGQAFVLALSGPAVLNIGYNVVNFNDFLCEKFLYCAPWFYKVITYVPIFGIPYVAYRFVDVLKPWPASLLDRDYNNCISNMVEALIAGLYTLLLLYSLSFILFDLTMDEALLFFHGVFNALFPNFHNAAFTVMSQLSDTEILEFLHLQDYYNDLVREHYNVPQK